MPKYAANPKPVRRINSLADLLAYLRDELGWPISANTVGDDLTFDWSADDPRLEGHSRIDIRPVVENRTTDIFRRCLRRAHGRGFQHGCALSDSVRGTFGLECAA